MHLNLSIVSIALVLSFLFGYYLGLRPAIAEIYQRNVVAAEREVMEQPQKREICVNDEVLQDFEADLYDTLPICSSFLGLSELVTTATITTRTSETLDLHTIIF